MTGRYVKTYAVDVNTSRTPEEGAHIPNYSNKLIITIIIVYARLNTSHIPEEGAHIPSWPNGPIIKIVVLL
jgi:hypothetical protein